MSSFDQVRADSLSMQLEDCREENEQLRAELAECRAERDHARVEWQRFIALSEDRYSDLAAAKAEIERLRREDFSNERVQNDTYRLALKVANEQLASRDLLIKQMREALEKITTFEATTPVLTYQGMEEIASEALALQPTQEALDEFVQRAVEQERERVAAKLLSIGALEDGDFILAIRAME